MIKKNTKREYSLHWKQFTLPLKFKSFYYNALFLYTQDSPTIEILIDIAASRISSFAPGIYNRGLLSRFSVLLELVRIFEVQAPSILCTVWYLYSYIYICRCRLLLWELVGILNPSKSSLLHVSNKSWEAIFMKINYDLAIYYIRFCIAEQHSVVCFLCCRDASWEGL